MENQETVAAITAAEWWGEPPDELTLEQLAREEELPFHIPRD